MEEEVIVVEYKNELYEYLLQSSKGMSGKVYPCKIPGYVPVPDA